MSNVSRKYSLEVLQEDIRDCKKCDLCKTMPFKPVAGIGPKRASVMIVGEAPGEDESIAEEPFVGACGRFLNKMLREAGIEREEVYVANTVNCRPTVDNLGKRNRPPSRSEIKTCQGWLFKQITEVQPKVIFTLGKIPTCSLLNLKATAKLQDFIGKPYIVPFSIEDLHDYAPIVIPTYHPSYLMVYGKKEYNIGIQTFKEGLKILTELD